MHSHLVARWPLRLLLLVLVGLPVPSFAGTVYALVKESAYGFGLQPRPDGVSVCFVGDALTARPDRVAEVTAAFARIEGAVNLRFTGFTACAPKKKGICVDTEGQASQCEMYPEDIRIVLDGTTFDGITTNRQIPSSYSDCLDLGAYSSWAHFPHIVDHPGYRACPWNAAIGDDSDPSTTPPTRYLDHPLHEIGHALGLAHEFLHEEYFKVEGPNGSICSSSSGTPYGVVNPGWIVELTHVDLKSVMLYHDTSCDVAGNYGFNGYSMQDRLALHILYPEPVLTAELFGRTVVRAGEMVPLRMVWNNRGARIGTVTKWIKWNVGGRTSTQDVFVSDEFKTPGTYPASLEYEDFLGRVFSLDFTVEVLASSTFDNRMAAVAAATGVMP